MKMTDLERMIFAAAYVEFAINESNGADDVEWAIQLVRGFRENCNSYMRMADCKPTAEVEILAQAQGVDTDWDAPKAPPAETDAEKYRTALCLLVDHDLDVVALEARSALRGLDVDPELL